MTFASIFRNYLEEQNISLSQFARMSGISRQALNNSLKRWEKNWPTLNTIRKISKLLNIDPKFFLNRM